MNCPTELATKMTGLVFAGITGSLLITIITVNGQSSLPRPDRNCQLYRDRSGQLEITGNDDSVYCLQQHLYQSALSTSPTNASIVYVQALLRKALSRCGGYGSGYGSPKSIKRKCSWERKEVRMMSRSEWKRFTNRLNILKKPIRLRGGSSFIPYDVISDIHRSDRNLDAAHGGPSFLGWHRVYLLLLETALGVSIPYWDSRLDYDMTQPTESILWTSEFFGPGYGIVDSGPFAGWITADNVSLVRNIGSGGSLISASMVEDILRHKSHDPVTEPSRRSVSIERIHGGPHVWVDGQLSSLQTAPQEPVFFLHHSFVDYIWYLFRENMRNNGYINPSSDYPNKGPNSHSRNANMIPFGNLSNIDGYSDFLESLTRYQASPTCPKCGRSKYLECDKSINRCKSKANRTTVKALGAANSQNRRTLAAITINLGTKFLSPQTDPRTRGDVISFVPLTTRLLLV